MVGDEPVPKTLENVEYIVEVPFAYIMEKSLLATSRECSAAQRRIHRGRATRVAKHAEDRRSE